MDKLQTIADFYADKLDLMPDKLRTEVGHFNVVRTCKIKMNGIDTIIFYNPAQSMECPKL